MTEAFMEAVESLNGLAHAMEAMDEDELRIMSFFICDLAAHIQSEDNEGGWSAHCEMVRLQ